MFEKDKDDDYEKEGKEGKGVGAVLAVLFFPAVLFGLLVYGLLRVFRLRFSVIASIVALLQLITVLLWWKLDFTSTIIDTVTNYKYIADDWKNLIPPVLALSVFIGGFIGMGIVAWELREMRNNPHRLVLPGNWMYKFEFRRTPRELMRKKSLVGKLKAGSLREDGKSPLGLNEEGEYQPVFRYQSEANKHTLIVGNSGSGKALHKDTLIPTPFGMTTVEKAKVGDAILDETGKATTILGKYQPMTEDHYLVKFSNGTTVKSCGDHQWTVELLGTFDKKGRPLIRLLTDEQRESIINYTETIPSNEEISISRLREKFSIPDTISLRSTLKNLPKISDQYSGVYRREDLLTGIKRARKRLTDEERAELLEFLDTSEEFVTRQELLAVVNKPIVITHITRGIKKKITKETVWDAKVALLAILDEDTRRILREEELNAPKVIATDTRSTRDMYLEMNGKDRSIYAIPLVKGGVDYEDKVLPITPYALGAWIGDGNSRIGSICGVDAEVKARIIQDGYSLSKEDVFEINGKLPIFNWKFDELSKALRELGLIKTKLEKGQVIKDIPDEYLYTSRQNRIQLLSGLLDTDGSISQEGIVEFGLTNEKVILKARQLVASLGWKVTKVYKKVGSYRDDDGTLVSCKKVYSFAFIPNEQVFNVKRKAERLEARLSTKLSRQIRHTKNYIVSIEKIIDNREDYYCFEVDSPSHLFLCTESFIATHNTITMQSLILSDIQAETPVILIDMKRSPEFASKLAKWASDNEGNFYHFVNGTPFSYDVPNSPGQSFYDPLAAGQPTSKADMVLGMREYDAASAVYRSNMQQLLQVLFNMLFYADKNHPALLADGYQTARTLDGRELNGAEVEVFTKENISNFTERPEVFDFTQKWLDENRTWAGKIVAERTRQSEAKFRKEKNRVWSEKEEKSAQLAVFRSLKGDYVTILLEAGILERRFLNRIDWDKGGIYQVYSATKPGAMAALATACAGTPIESEAREIAEQLKGKTQIAHALEELRGQMRTIVASEYGRWLRTAPPGEGQSIDLFSLTQKPKSVILFSLNSDSEPDFARFIGSMIMSDITNVSARRRNQQLQNQVNVYIDEFQAINPSSVAGLLEKSRESKIAMTLAQQSFEQIVASTANNGEAYLLSIMDTCSNFIVHAGSTEDSAERLAKILGKEWVDEYRASNKNKSFFLSGNWANKRNQTVQTSREERWKFSPARFMALSSPDKNNNFKATAVVVNKTCSDPLYKGRSGAVARTVWMVPPDIVLEKYYTPTFQESHEPVKIQLAKQPLESSDEVIAPNDFDLLALRTENRNKPVSPAALPEDDDEEEDGGFNYEVIEEDEDSEDELLDLSGYQDKPVPAAAKPTDPPPPPRPPAARETSSFMKAKKSMGSERVVLPTTPAERRSPQTVTPPPPPKAEAPRESALDEIELPDLGF